MGFFNGSPLESEGLFVSRFCVQVVMILIIPRILQFTLLRHLLQPRVVSEIISGILLGPSCLGQIDGLTSTFFPARSLPPLHTLGQTGVFLFLFMTGCHLNLERIMHNKWEAVCGSLFGLGLTFAIAPGVAEAFSDHKYTSFSHTQLIILIAVILSISAEAVLARIQPSKGA